MTTSTRADSYVLLLNQLKGLLSCKCNTCILNVLPMLAKIQLEPNYANVATTLEKSNITALQGILTTCTAQVKAIVWD